MIEPTDAQRLDWLEARANEKGGLLLHDGTERGRTGLGLRPGHLNRSLREAIDAAMGMRMGRLPRFNETKPAAAPKAKGATP